MAFSSSVLAKSFPTHMDHPLDSRLGSDVGLALFVVEFDMGNSP
jgi:hypothetical protein